MVAEKGLDLAVRVSSEPQQLQMVDTALPGQKRAFKLLSIPLYMVSELPRLVMSL